MSWKCPNPSFVGKAGIGDGISDHFFLSSAKARTGLVNFELDKFLPVLEVCPRRARVWRKTRGDGDGDRGREGGREGRGKGG